MNKYVWDSYKKLSDTERSELKFTFKNSPTVIKFIDFVESSKVANFKTTGAIEAVYGDEKEETPYNVLENRFFKLRKKVQDAMTNSKENDVSHLHTDEEKRFVMAKQLIANENKEAGYKQLQELEKTCWEKNVFELLPSIIDQIIFCNQSFNRLDNNIPLYVKQKKAIDLLNDMHMCTMTARKIYEINFTIGIKHAQKELGYLRNLATKNKEYPRFLLCYHHVSAYYKLGSKDYTREMQVLSRHLTAFKKLQAKYPLVPLMMYKANYVQLQHMHFSQMVMSYHFGRCEFEETYQIMKETSEQMENVNSVFKTHKTEAFYYNMITAQCMTHRYSEALETINTFMSYLKNNNQTDKLVLANTLKARIYSEVFPQTLKLDPTFMMEQVEEYIKVLRKADNMMVSLDQTLLLKAKLLIISGGHGKAAQVLKDPVVVNYLKLFNLTQPFIQLTEILIDNSSQKIKKLQELSRSVQSLKHHAKTPAEILNILWLQGYLKYLLR